MAYTRIEHAGGAPATTVPSSLTAVATTIPVADGTSWPTGGTGPFYATLDLGTDSEEKVKVATRTGNNLNGVTRGVDGSTATTHDAGATIAHTFTAIEADEANVTAINTIGRVTAAGDLLVADGTNSLARLAKGANDTLLKITAGAVGWGTLPADSVGPTQIAPDAVTASEIAANAVGASELADNAVDTAAIVNNAVTSSKIGTDAVGPTQIAPDAVGSSEIAPDSVGASELADNAVDTAAIVNLAVTAAKIALDTITAAQIAPDAITASELANNAVDTAAIVAGAVTLTRLDTIGANAVFEGLPTSGAPSVSARGRSWANKMESDSVPVDTTPTKINALNLATVAMKAGRRYRLEFSGALAITAGSTGNCWVGFRRGTTSFSRQLTPTLNTLVPVGFSMTTFYEPAADEAVDWDIYMESVSGSYNVRIKGTATEETAFIITDIGHASNT